MGSPLARPRDTRTASEVGLRRSPAFLREIEDFPARLLGSLPVPLTLWLDIPGAPVPVCFTTAVASGEPAPLLAPQISFDRDELAALVIGVEADRVWRKELLGLCFEKWRRPALRISAKDTLAGAMPELDQPAWTLGEVLARLGAELTQVELADEAPARPGFPVAA